MILFIVWLLMWFPLYVFSFVTLAISSYSKEEIQLLKNLEGKAWHDKFIPNLWGWFILFSPFYWAVFVLLYIN